MGGGEGVVDTLQLEECEFVTGAHLCGTSNREMMFIHRYHC